MMLVRTKRLFAAVTAAGALAVSIGVPVSSAQQSGLVNVDVHNVLNNNTTQVTIPINAAANICGVAVNVLTANLASGPVSCSAGANQQFNVLGFA
jgi:hypothetical protein